MNVWIHVAAIALMAVAVFYAMFRLHRDMKEEPVYSEEKDNKMQTQKQFSNIKECLQILNTTMQDTSIAPKKIAEVMEALVYDGYIPVHLMTNEGNNYSDRLQKIGFRCMLSSENIQTINSVEGRNGQY